MRRLSLFAIWSTCALAAEAQGSLTGRGSRVESGGLLIPNGGKLAPKVFIIDMFTEEGEAWYGIPEFDLLANNISVAGFSPLFPEAHCTSDRSICQVVTGEGEINAAVTITSLVQSQLFDLTKTYFLIAGIAGVNPKLATIGGVTFARFAVQVGLQDEIDAREIPSNFSTGYVPQGATAPGQSPTIIYGTEVFELNDNLRRLAVQMASQATLFDDASSQNYRANYASDSRFAPGAAPPSVVACDTATADQFWSGNLLATAMDNVTTLFTNGTGEYCTTQQEDSATLEALLRGAILDRVDFSRIILMRTASDFDRPFDGQTAVQNLFFGLSGFTASITNLRIAGVEVVQGIVKGWQQTFARGVKPGNYIGDILGSLGGQPDFGPGNVFGGNKAPSKRASRRRFLGGS